MRSAALLVPLFSARTRRDAGIGEITALPALADLARRCGCSMLQLLPLGEAVAGDHSPYSSRSAFAIDPIHIGLEAVEDLRDGGDGPWEAALGRHLRVALERCRAAKNLQPATVRLLKEAALAKAFARFREKEWATRSARAADLRRFSEEEGFWLDDYALFRALEVVHGGASWLDWPAALRDRDPAALAERAKALEDLVLFFRYQQWLADRQWLEARKSVAGMGVRLAGDLPFMVARDSVDLWAHRDTFLLDASVGAPPDALAPEGQDWDLPPYRWDELRKRDYDWIKGRARRSAELFDLYRVDHVVGYYRTYVIARGAGAKEGRFFPSDEPTQVAQAEAVLRAMREPGAELIAEDLGTIPPFVRQSLERLAMPGFKVLRWERAWDAPGRPFHDPRAYPPCSVATSGTHDTSTLAVWWEKELTAEDRRALAQVPALEALRGAADGSPPRFGDEVRLALLEALAASGSDLLILPIQDILGAREQVNVPGTIGPENWTYRLPFALEDVSADDGLRRPLGDFAVLARKHGRG